LCVPKLWGIIEKALDKLFLLFNGSDIVIFCIIAVPVFVAINPRFLIQEVVIPDIRRLSRGGKLAVDDCGIVFAQGMLSSPVVLPVLPP
jgi:hypothetical protein